MDQSVYSVTRESERTVDGPPILSIKTAFPYALIIISRGSVYQYEVPVGLDTRSVLIKPPAGMTNLVPNGGLLFNDGAVAVAYIRTTGRLLIIAAEIFDL